MARPEKCCEALGEGVSCFRCGKHTHFTVEWILPAKRGDNRPACSLKCANERTQLSKQ